MAKLDIVNANNVIESNPQRAYFKLKNTGGPKGDKGDTGERGPQGATGPQGPAGLSASVRVGSTTTLNPGADATVTNSGDSHNVVLDFGIPTGAQGPKGDTGIQGPRGPQGFQGPKGDTGAAATVQVGNTNTGAPGTNAQVTNVGTQYNAKLNFTIPRGDKGETGSQGPQGPKGADGKDGVDGYSPSATVTQEGLNAEIEITDKDGTTTATVPGFGVQVVDSLPATGSENIIYLERDSTTVSGNPIAITDAVAAPLVDYEILGNTTQNTLSGKNLFDGGTPDYTAHAAWNGYGNSDYSIVDGGYSFPNRYNAIAFEFDNLVEGEDYTFSADYVGSATFFFSVGVNMYSGGSSLPHSSQDYAAKTTKQRFLFTFTASATNRIGINSGYTSGTTLTITNIQLEKGSATSYEPYCGGVPSPNPSYPQTVNTVTGEQTITINNTSYEVNLGKNLFNATPVNTITGQLQPDKTFSTSQGSTIWIPCSPNTTYTVSKVNTSRTRLATSEALLDGTNTATNYVAGTSVTQDGRYYGVITSGSQDRYLYLTYAESTGVAPSTVNIQIELGSSASSYEDFSPIELCKIGDYQDYIYKDGSDWKIHKACDKHIFTSSLLGWSPNSLVTGGYVMGYASQSPFYGKLAVGNASSYQSFCSHFLFQRDSVTWTADGKCGFNTGGAFWCVNSEKTTRDDFLAWLGETNPSVYYPLVASAQTDTTITNASLISQLEAILAGETQAGTNNIVLTPTAGATGSLAVGYYNAYASYLYVNGQWQKFAMLTGANN